MIPGRYFQLEMRMARELLRHCPAGERMIAERVAQLRNASLDVDIPEADRSTARDQFAELRGLLDRHRAGHLADDGGPTPEGKAKRRRDVIGAMVKAGTLSPQQADAAEALARGYSLTVADVSNVGQFRYQPPMDRPHIEDWTSSQVTAYRRYGLWRAQAHGKGLNIPAIVTVIVEPVGMREVEARHQMRNGTLTPQLQDALSLYIEIAGWVPQPQNIVENQRAGTSP